MSRWSCPDCDTFVDEQLPFTAPPVHLCPALPRGKRTRPLEEQDGD
jgi:hypothetical protein